MSSHCEELRRELEAKRALKEVLEQEVIGTGRSGDATRHEITELEADIKRLEGELTRCTEAMVFACDDGALYYVRETGNMVYWYGEHDQLAFANIFVGQRSGNSLRGRWLDVPKGAGRSDGEITLAMDAETGAMSKTSATGGFSGSQWVPFAPYAGGSRRNRLPSILSKPQYQGEDDGDLTGTWTCDDGGSYYVRQVGQTIAWFGESNAFSNVFIGSRIGNTINGNWADVSKRDTRGSGSLSLELGEAVPLVGSAPLFKRDSTGGFSGSRWVRVDILPIVMRLSWLVLHDTSDSIFGDEPYLWTFFILVDGKTVDISNLADAAPIVVSTSGSRRNIVDDTGIDEGTRLPIPQRVGTFRTRLTTIRGFNPTSLQARRLTTCAVVVVAWDEELGSNEAYEAGRRAMTDELQLRIRDFLRDGRQLVSLGDEELRDRYEEWFRENIQAMSERVAGAIVLEGPGFWGSLSRDTKIGVEYRTFSFGELHQGGRISIDLNFHGGDAHYQVLGSVRAV